MEAAPEPLRLTCCGLVILELATVSVPALAPTTVGENTIVTVQLAWAAKLLAQELLIAKSFPVTAMELRFKAASPTFVSVTEPDALLPSEMVPNDIAVTLNCRLPCELEGTAATAFC